MPLTPNKSSVGHTVSALLTTPVDSLYHWGVIVVVALAFIWIPQLPPPNDWARNTAGLVNGLHVYLDPSFVYPPWSLILLWPYRLMTAPGSRIASVLVVGWLTAQQEWTLLRFGAIVASPFFMWTMVTSNVDVLALLLPVVLWRASEGKSWQWLGWTISLLMLLIKPQSGLVVLLYLLWKHRDQARSLVVPLVAVVLIVVPISLLGEPYLILQWIGNAVVNPSKENLHFWSINNVSLTDHVGLIPGGVLVAIAMGGVYALLKLRARPWTQNHKYSSMFLLSMLLGPYSSNQGMIVPLALVPSWWSVAMQYAVLLILSYLEIFRENSAWVALLLGVSALWLYVPRTESLPQVSKHSG